MNDIEFCTPSSKIKCSCNVLGVKVNDLNKYCNKQYTDNLCKVGCVNYNKKWSCPPYSPDYSMFSSKYSDIIVIVLCTEMFQFSYIKNDYLKIKAANTVMKSRIDQILRSYIDDNHYYISTGSCRLCKPCKCKKGDFCAHPDLMSYSFESLGINVSEMVKDLLDFELLWYKKDHLPQYTSVVAGLLYNGDFFEEEFMQKLMAINS